MKPPLSKNSPSLTTELLLLPDGRILVHNLTPAFAALLGELNPNDEQIAPRRDAGEAASDSPFSKHSTNPSPHELPD